MIARTNLWVLIACAAGCGGPAVTVAEPPAEVLFLVHNQVHAIRIDGTGRRLVAVVGDDRHRTAWPRFLPDGRVAVLADDTGGIFPYVGRASGGAFTALPMVNVTLSDSLCGVTVDGRSRLLFTVTPFVPSRSLLERVDVDAPALEPVGWEVRGVLSDPSAYDVGRVLAVRTIGAASQVQVLDVSGRARQNASALSLAELDDPLRAAAPARLPDGRVVFLRIDRRVVGDAPTGEIVVIEASGALRETGLTRVLALEVVGGQLIYEEGGESGVSDLIRSDLIHPPVNLTQTPFISEHLGWSD